MQSVTVSKDELTKRVTANRASHRDLYERAFAGFKRQMRQKLEESLEMLERGEVPPLQLGLVVPEDHTADYDQVLEMLAMSVDDEIKVDYQSFRSYVMDEWGWKQSFTNSTSAYMNS
jgi:hypothetical protein